MRLVESVTCPVRPWVNGGGTTRVLAARAARDEALVPEFDWRVSLADIDRAGPFSAMPGVERVFAVLEGEVELVFEPAAPEATGAHRVAASRRDPAASRRTLDVAAPPIRFRGESAPRATPAGESPCRALNLMVARDRFSGAMRRVALADGEALDPRWVLSHARIPGFVHGCFVQRGAIAVGPYVAQAGELALLDADDPAVRASGTVALLEFVAVGTVEAAEARPAVDPDDAR
jgi:environmental stress-induced protein Ves